MQDVDLALLLDLEQLFAEAQPLEDDIGAIDQDRIIRAKTDQTGSAELHNNLC